MNAWQDFLDSIFGDADKPGKVMICFVNRYLEGMDDVRYKIKYDGLEKSGTTTAQNYCVELTPKSLDPIQTFVWSRKAMGYKNLDDVIPVTGRKKLVRKVLKTFKIPAKTEQLPKTPPKPRPTEPTPATAPAPSPTAPQGVLPQQTKNESNQPQTKAQRSVPGEITVEQLRKIFPLNKGRPSDAHLQAIANELNANLVKYKLDTTFRRAHFFGQIKRESPDLSGAAESLSYTPQGLIATFSYYAKAPSEAQADGRIEKKDAHKRIKVIQPANQEAIANKVYARKDLGNTSPGDGWKYRGRGMKQLTGLSNYKNFNQSYPNYWSEQKNFEEHPELVAEFPYTLRSAVYFWIENRCWNAADNGITDAAIDEVTRIVNSGEIKNHNQGKYESSSDPVMLRRKYTRLAYAAFT